ncbi:hypothetical protein AAG747_23475 [Rapidithrix thailandica]|uniref:Lipoprotein n=1 Tax=Rapidithrix thailandica TaxID=413964 RepID=A0AAW9SJ91_9BACT
MKFNAPWICLGILLTWMSACNVDKKKTIPEEAIEFTTTDQSRMFFNNVRTLDYDQEEDDQTDRVFYRIEERNTDTLPPVLNLCIVNDPFHYRAYIMLEPNAYFSQPYHFEVVWKDSLLNTSGSISFQEGNIIEQYLFITKLYNKLLAQCQFYIKEENMEIPLLNTAQEREAFRKTMIDYYRLINVL